ncbi:MAG TPA: NAD(P)/FAD-dependent oxidoreductase [Rhizobiales bacterium]|nr:NAD(P)/FAD-dependent oxidoreductase [Hyphomicrobiales bacterium]
MADLFSGRQEKIDVAIIGGGPAGLSAATELKRRSVRRVCVLEREPHAGGIPRHCGHPPFGMREFKRIYTGPHYAKRLVETAQAAGVEIHTSTSVVEARRGGELLITTSAGPGIIRARRIIYATGVRETPRSARLISGARPLGVMNTGALQSMVYLKNCKPFERPLIVGTELVSFSAIMTCRHARIKPVAMIEARGHVTARWPSSLYARLAGVPLHLNTRLIDIEGKTRVSAAVVENAQGEPRTIECDGILLTGQFTPEASLARCGHLDIDTRTGGPVVDQFGRCSDPAYFATGNVLRPVETAGWSWNEGRQTGRLVADDLAGRLPAEGEEVEISPNSGLIRFAMPQRIILADSEQGMENLQLRFSKTTTGTLEAVNGKGTIWHRKMSVHPERRVLVPLRDLVHGAKGGQINLNFKETAS